MIMARTDAIATDGFKRRWTEWHFFKRSRRPFFAEAPTDLNQRRQIPQEISGRALLT